ncbi:MAG: hypothetical protein ACFFE6_00985 [Candidatus Thorarchaeota archaeon]
MSHHNRILIFLTLLLGVALLSTVPQTPAFEYDLIWDLEDGVLFPCRYITGTNETGTLDIVEKEAFLRIENEPSYVHNITTWDEIPNVNVSMFSSLGIVTEPEFFKYIIQDAGLIWTGYDWFKPAISYWGIDESTWNAVYEDLMKSWTGPWGLDINVTILPDPYYEVYSLWDQTFWAIEYNFTYEGVFYDVMVSYWLFPSWPPSASNSGLLQNVTITGEDATSEEIMNFFQLICDPSPPFVFDHSFIIYPEDGGRQATEHLNYTVGDTGYAIYWNVMEDYPVDYVIYDNDAIFTSGLMNLTRNRADDHIEINIDGLEVGLHNFTCVVTNTVGRTGSDWVLVNVTSSRSLLENNLPQIIVAGVGVTAVLLGIAVYYRRK